MISVSKEAARRLERLRTLNRARGHYLYDRHGNRYIDLYLNGGACLLGHRPDRYSLVLKQTLEKGLTADYPAGPYKRRIEKILQATFSDFPHIRFFANRERAAFFTASRNDLPFSGLGETAENGIFLWRPYFSVPDETRLLLPLYPLPGSFQVQVVCSREPLEGIHSDPVSPFVLSGMLRVMEECRTLPELPDYLSALDDLEGYQRNQCYFSFSGMKEAHYAKLFDYFWENGILIPPELFASGCFPLDLTESDLKKMNKVLKGRPH